jgi:hypothetical protein
LGIIRAGVINQSRRGLICQVAASIRAVMAPLMMAAIGIATARIAVAAHPIEENASANVAMRDEVWRRRKWLRLACKRNQSWIAAADTVAMTTKMAVTAACTGEATANAAVNGAKMAVMAIITTSILARITLPDGIGADAIRSAASSPEIVSQARPPASWPAAITMTGVISTVAAELSEKLRHSIKAGGSR